MTYKDTTVLILGAGFPHKGNTPSVLCETTSGKVVLHWMMKSLGYNKDQVEFIAGYKADQIRKNFPQLSVIVNNNWESMGSCGSLFASDLNKNTSLIVSYGDILFRSDIVRKLESSDSKISVVWDSNWKINSSKLSDEHLNRCEKIKVKNGKVLRIGDDIPSDWSDGKFIGLVRFSPEALRDIKKLEERPEILESLKKLQLSSLIEYLRSNGNHISAIDVKGDWVEVNEPKDIAYFIMGTKADTLRRLRRSVECSNIQDQLTFTKAEWEGDKNKILRLANKLILNNEKSKNLIVRSSTRTEDKFDSANAGKYLSLLNIAGGENLIKAINEVIESFGKESNDDDQILLQPMVVGVIASGVALTRTLENSSPWKVINYEESEKTDAITSGTSKKNKTFIFKRSIENIDKHGPLWMSKLYKSIIEIEELLGYDNLDIEFAITEDYVVHILQVRPIAVKAKNKFSDSEYENFIEKAHFTWKKLALSPPHIPGESPPLYGIMPDWNPAEIIGTAPGSLANSLYGYLITNEVWAMQRAEFGYRDIRPAPLIVNFAGRPYVDVRLSIASFIPKDIDSELAGKFINNHLKYLINNPHLHDKIEFNVVPTCISANYFEWEKRLSNDDSISRENITLLKNNLSKITRNAFSRPVIELKKVKELEERQYTLRQLNISPIEKARLMIDNCRTFGTLPFAHLARCAFIAMELLNGSQACGIIPEEAKISFLSSIRTVTHQFTEDLCSVSKGCITLNDFLSTYGHLRPGTYDVTSDRYDVHPEYYIKDLDENSLNQTNELLSIDCWQSNRNKFIESLKSLNLPSDVDIVENFLRDSIQGREYAKFVFTRSLSDALEQLVLVGDTYGLAREDISNLSIEELLATRDSTRSNIDLREDLARLSNINKKNRELSSECEFPPLITKQSDLDCFFVGSDLPNFVGYSEVTAKCIHLSDDTNLQDISVKDKIVLVAQADPGYDWLFAQGIVGLITLYGGKNSHMAIRASEFHLPAAIGVGEKLYLELSKANVIQIDSKNKILRNIQ